MHVRIREVSLVAMVTLVAVSAAAEDQSPSESRFANYPAAERKAMEALQGNWRLVELKRGDEVVSLPDRLLTFDGRQVHVQGNRARTGESEFVHTYAVNPTREPAELNMYGDRFLIQAIYRIEGDVLTVAHYGRPEIARASSFEADGTDDAGALMTFTYRRVE